MMNFGSAAMTFKWSLVLSAAWFLAGIAFAQSAEARVVKFQVEQRGPYLGGVSWDKAGPYEMLTGTAFMEVNPADPQNAIIIDVDHAPRNSQGRVEFSTPFVVLTPADPARRSRKLFFALNNRGNTQGGLIAPTSQAQMAGTLAGAAMERGYTVVDAGWEGDIVPAARKLIANLPVAVQSDGSPITGLMRYEYYDRPDGSYTTNLEGTAAFRSYPAADTDSTHATLTVRDSEAGARRPIASSDWAFGSCPKGKESLVPGNVDLCYFAGFDSTKIYELIYTATNPIVLGLGFATTRDIASFLRYETRDEAGNANPLFGVGIARAYAAGGSQGGGFLRDFIYLGFNEDESHRRVFDGVMPWIAGTDRVMINVRFADPNASSVQDHQHDYLQNSYPPFTYGETIDPNSRIRDAILKRPATDPLVMQVDLESEFWQFRGSLNVVDGQGGAVPIPPNVRLYFVGNTAHGFLQGGFRFRALASNPLCAYPTPTSGSWETQRASLINLDKWADEGVAPPASNYPSLSDGTLVTLEEAAAAFPRVPGYAIPTVYHTYEWLNFGPEFGSRGGVLTLIPPRHGTRYTVLLPKSDDSGIQLAGVRPIEARVPVGTSVGWNVRKPEHRAPDLCGAAGSYAPFATTKAERVAKGDPRPSLEERYGNHAGFVAAVRKAADAMVAERFMLPEDAQSAIAAADASDVLR